MKGTALVIHKEIEIEAPPERVWPYVATRDGCRRWFCNVAEVFELTLEPHPGGRYEDHMVVKGKTYRSDGEIIIYDPPRQFAYRYRSRFADGSFGPPNTVTITLVEQGPHTRVILEETGFEQQPEEIRRRYFESNDQGWAASMEDLRTLIVQEVLPALGHLLIFQTIEINAPADRVWRYLATDEGRSQRLRLSYPDSHTQRETFEAREGGRWESSGISAHNGDPYRQFGRILTYDPPRRLILTLQEDGWPAETTVTYQLTEYYGKTRVTLVHSGFEHLPAERRERTRKAYEIGRFKGLERLRDMIEGRAVEVQYPIHIRKEIDLDASIDRVWWYVGTQEGSLRRHAAESVPGETEYQAEVLEARVGGQYELRGIFQRQSFHISGQVVAYDPPRGLALTWREEGWPVDTLVTFRLTATAPGKTRLVVIHNGFEHLPRDIRKRAAVEYEQGRQRGLDTLRRILSEWTIRKEVDIEAPPEAVWAIAATQVGMRRWWDAPALMLDERTGGRLDSAGIHQGSPYHHIGAVAAYDPPRRFVFTLREDQADGTFWPQDSVITISLHAHEGRTHVVVEHDFARLPDALRERLVNAYRRGWTDDLMEHLRALVLERVREE